MTYVNRDARATASPPPADYCDDLSDEFSARIDEECDQAELSRGRVLKSFDWSEQSPA